MLTKIGLFSDCSGSGSDGTILDATTKVVTWRTTLRDKLDPKNYCRLQAIGRKGADKTPYVALPILLVPERQLSASGLSVPHEDVTIEVTEDYIAPVAVVEEGSGTLIDVPFDPQTTIEIQDQGIATVKGHGFIRGLKPGRTSAIVKYAGSRGTIQSMFNIQVIPTSDTPMARIRSKLQHDP